MVRNTQIPYRGPGATGLGKPLKSILHGRSDMKVYTASISPKGIELAAELADGILPVWMSPGLVTSSSTSRPLEAGSRRPAAARASRTSTSRVRHMRDGQRPREVP